MPQVKLMLVDDDRGRWGPLGDLRAVFELRTGALTTLERVEQVIGRRTEAVVVPPALAPLAAERYPHASINTSPDSDYAWRVVNGRCARRDVLEAAAALEEGEVLQQEDGQFIAGHLRYAPNHVGWQPGRDVRVVKHVGRALLERPWHVLDEMDVTVADDLFAMDLPLWDGRVAGVAAYGDHPIKVHPSAVLRPGVVLGAEAGPIVIDAQATIGATAVLEGPCYIGAGSQVGPGAHIRSATAIGPICRIGGEVSHSIFQSFSNKTHGGYLGHALVGQWVNLGAATNASNLKNTYGSVRMQLSARGPREDTGLLQIGPILGDYVRTAIGTRIPTGAVIGTGCMISLSGFAPTFADRFGFHTDAGFQAYDLDKFLQTAHTMMQRRQQRLSPVGEQRLIDLARDSDR